PEGAARRRWRRTPRSHPGSRSARDSSPPRRRRSACSALGARPEPARRSTCARCRYRGPHNPSRSQADRGAPTRPVACHRAIRHGTSAPRRAPAQLLCSRIGALEGLIFRDRRFALQTVRRSSIQGTPDSNQGTRSGKPSPPEVFQVNQRRFMVQLIQSSAPALRTLSVDIGGTGTKMLVLDHLGTPLNERARRLTPQPALPAAVLETIGQMLAEQPPFDRVSVGFPGVVTRGIVRTAPNLDTAAWRGFPLERALLEIVGCPVRALNDADLQGYGVIAGRGVELVLTLGTGMGAALFTDGHLVPNLELGHHPFEKGHSYEERVSDAELKRIGKPRWNE